MARSAVFTFAAYDRDGICAAQQLGAAGNLTINGALLDKPATMNGVRRVSYRGDGFQRTTSIYSAGNLSAVNFSVYGYLKGEAVSETGITGPNNSTVETTQLFDIVTRVAADAAVGSDVEVGNGTTGKSAWFKPDRFQSPFNVGIQANHTATLQYDVNYTLDDVDDTTSPVETAVAAGMTNATSDQVAALTTPAAGIRANIDSSTDGVLVLTIIQAG